MTKFLAIVFIMCCVLFLTACVPKQASPIQPFISPEPKENNVKITLFFGDSNAMDMVQEKRDVVRKNESLEVIVLRELIKGPSIPEGRRTLPAETKLISVEVADRIAYANFSRELVSKHPGGSAGERMTVMSIVYTLTELPGIEKVQLLLEGEKKEAMFGHGITIDPIGRPPIDPETTTIQPNMGDSPVWQGLSEELAGDVVTVGSGKITGSPLDIAAFAGGHLYLFSQKEDGFRMSWRMPLDRFVTSFTAADLTGDGWDELIVAGAVSGNFNPGVPGFVAVYTWQNGSLIKLTDLSRDIMPFWSVGSFDITGDGLPEVLVSNANAMFVFEWKNNSLQQIHYVTRFAGTIATARISGVEQLAWRDSNGSNVGVFAWEKGEWVTIWMHEGQGEWASGTPTYGSLAADDTPVYGIMDLAGFWSLFDATGNRLTVPDELQQEITIGPSFASPVIVPKQEMVVFGRGNRVVVYNWTNKTE